MVVLGACSSSRGIVHSSQPIVEHSVSKPTPPTLASGLMLTPATTESVVFIEPTPEFVASTTLEPSLAVQETQLAAQLFKANQLLSETKQGEAKAKTQKLNLAQKLVLKKVTKQLAKAKTKLQPTDGGDFNSLDGNLKIGLILIGIGILLAIFGLGLIGGLAALIGLAFVILGLLNSY